MKVIVIKNPRWLEEIINKKEYHEIKKRSTFIGVNKKIEDLINFEEEIITFKEIKIKLFLEDYLFEFNSMTKKISIK